MEFRNWSSPDYHYSGPMPHEDCYSYSAPCEEWMDAPTCARDYDIRNGQIPAMQRYLEEPMQHVFPTYASDRDGLCVQPWSGYPLRPVEYAALSHDVSYGPVQGVPSPGSHSFSGSSSYVSSNPGEPREASSWASPELAMVDCVPAAYYPDHAAYEYCEPIQVKHSHAEPRGFGSCVALHDVQHRADEQPDEPAGLEDDSTAYPGYLSFMDAEDGYQPLESSNSNRRSFEHALSPQQQSAPGMMLDSCASSPTASPQTPSSPAAKDPSISPNIRRRRAPSSLAAASHNNSHRINKRRSTASTHHKHTDEPTPSRAFPCSLAIYGCPSTFGSKNEWKRHINTQHMRLDFWRCDQCPATRPNGGAASSAATTSNASTTTTTPRKFNDFNRKDLFIQHVRRMHPVAESPAEAPSTTTTTASNKKLNGRNASAAAAAQAQTRAQDAALMAIASRCRVRTRSPPSGSGCLFCGVRFHGADSWDERLEHIGRHFECLRKSEGGGAGSSDGSGKADPRCWRPDALVEEWMLEEGILVRPRGKAQRPVLA